MPILEEAPLEQQLAQIPNVDILELRNPPNASMMGQRVLKALLVTDRSRDEIPDSAQLEGYEGTVFAGLDAIEPPYNPALWALSTEQNTRLTRSIASWARNTVGLGWRIVPKDPEGNVLDLAELQGPLKTKFDSERALLQRLFKFPNLTMPFTRLMYLVKTDEEAMGNGYLEVVRNNMGMISALYHIPAYTMRVRRGGKGYVQIRNLMVGTGPDSSFMSIDGSKPDKRFFKMFGDPRMFNRDTGSLSGQRLGLGKRATEIIHFKIYTHRSPYYGAPRYVATAPAVAGNRLAAERNVSFFDNDAVPRGIIFVTGGKLDGESVRRIEGFIRAKSQGTENAHRMLVLQLESKRTALGEEGGASMHFQPLTVGVTEDASFLAYRRENDEEVRESFALSESYFRTDTVNRASAEVGRATTNEQEFEPDRQDKEFTLNHTIVADPGWNSTEGTPWPTQQDGLGMEVAQLEFRRPQIADPVEKSRINVAYGAAGGLTPNDLRRELGKDPYPDEYEWANKPLPWALAELAAGVVGLDGKRALIPPPPPGGGASGPPRSANKALDDTVARAQDNLTDIAKQVMSDLDELEHSTPGGRPDGRKRSTLSTAWQY